MKKMMIPVMALALAAGMTACGTQNRTSGAGTAKAAEQHTEQTEESAMELITGGWTVSGETAIEQNPEAKAALEKALSGMVGAEYTPVAVLGTQVVAGTNYCILCKVTAVVPGAQPSYELVYVYEDLSGNAEITDSKEIVLGEHDEKEAGPETGMTQIANPWSEYVSAAEAAQAAGIPFAAPETLGGAKISYIQAMNGIAEVRYGTVSIRKGSGTEDISGDYNIYAEIHAVTVADAEVTLRGNDGKVYGAVWNDGTYSYAYYAEDGVTAEAAQAQISEIIAENTK